MLEMYIDVHIPGMPDPYIYCNKQVSQTANMFHTPVSKSFESAEGDFDQGFGLPVQASATYHRVVFIGF